MSFYDFKVTGIFLIELIHAAKKAIFYNNKNFYVKVEVKPHYKGIQTKLKIFYNVQYSQV